VFKERLLWKIFGRKREEELKGEGRKSYNEVFSGFYSLNKYGNDQIKENVMSRHVAYIGGDKKCIEDFDGEN